MTDRELQAKIVQRRAQLDQVEAAINESMDAMRFGRITAMVAELDGDLDRAERNRFVTIDCSKFRILTQCAALVIGRYSLERAEAILGEPSHGLE